MLAEPAGVLWFVALTVFLPGVVLLALASSRLARASGIGPTQLRGVARKLGITFVGATGFLALYLLPRLLDGPRGGGLGSMGDPLGAILMLGYIFVLAPFATLAAGLVCVLYAVRWHGARRSRAG